MKRIISVLLVLTMMSMLAVGLTACGESETESKASESETPVGSETKVDSETSEAGTTANDSIDEDSEEPEDEIPGFVDKQLKSSTQYGVDGSVIETKEYNMNGILIRDVSGDVEEIYDDNGNLLERTTHDTENGDYSYKYTYNENGDILSEYYGFYTEYIYDEDGTLIETIQWIPLEDVRSGETVNWEMDNATKYVYTDDKSEMKEYFWYISSHYHMGTDDLPYPITVDIADDDWELTSCYEYTYYDDGSLETEHDYDSDMNLQNYYEYSYYDNGDLKEEKRYDGSLNLSSYTEYVYNDDGYKETTYNGDGSLSSEIEYNKNGDILSDTTYDSGEEIRSQTTNTYWSNGNLKTSVKTKKGEQTVEEEYDYCGNIISDSSDSTTYEYTYDEAGNKLTEKIIGDGKTTEYTYVNEYYD